MTPRPIRKVWRDPGFDRTVRRYPKPVKEDVEEREGWFKKDAFDSRLDTHRLKGKCKDYYTYRISKRSPVYLVLFQFLSADEVQYITVGTHDEINKYCN